MRKTALVSTVVTILAAAGSALAQDDPAAEPAPATAQAEPAEAPPAPPAEEAPPATAEASASVSAEGTPSGAEIAAAPGMAPTTEDEVYPPGWFRIDSDGLGLQLWAGATHTIGDLAIASDMYVGTLGGATFGEFDVGPAFTVADDALTITPMIGIAFCWELKQACSLVPQLFLVGGAGPVYFESWWQAFMNSVFVEDASNILYSRHFVTFALTDHVGIGPQFEPTFGLNNDQDTLVSAPLGGVLKLHYGKDNTFLGFLGYEMIEDARQVEVGVEDDGMGNLVPSFDEKGLVGRLTFIRNW